MRGCTVPLAEMPWPTDAAADADPVWIVQAGDRQLGAGGPVRRRRHVLPCHLAGRPESDDAQLRHERRLHLRGRRAQLADDPPRPTAKRHPMPARLSTHPIPTSSTPPPAAGSEVSRDRGRTFAPIGDLKESLSGEIAINPSDPNIDARGHARRPVPAVAGCGRHLDRLPGAAGPGDRLSLHSGRILFAATERRHLAIRRWRADLGREDGGLALEGDPGIRRRSDATARMLYCTVPSKVENGVLKGGVYRSRDRGETWQPAMGRGINMDTTTGRPVGLRSHRPVPAAPDHRRQAAHRLRHEHQHRLSPAAP